MLQLCSECFRLLYWQTESKPAGCTLWEELQWSHVSSGASWSLFTLSTSVFDASSRASDNRPAPENQHLLLYFTQEGQPHKKEARTHTHTQTQVMCQPGISVTHTLIILQSVWPLASHLQKSNQYVNSVISVRSVPTPFTQKSELLVHSSGPHRISGMKYKYSTARGGKATGYRAATFFPRRFIEHVKYPPSTHSDNQLWKYFSNVKCPNASEAMQAIPSGSRIRAGVCTLPVPTQQTSLNPTGCFSAAAAR